jgi:1,2-beta-oligoglucan phosphorylase
MLSIDNTAGLQFEFNDNGSLRHLRLHEVHVNLFVGNELEGGPANLWLRLRDDNASVELVPLLGPRSPLSFCNSAEGLQAEGTWRDLRLRLTLRLAADAAAWFWHLRVDNLGSATGTIQLLHVQDLGLAAYGAIRTNEYYVSHYIDLCPLRHSERGWVVAARQNQAAGGCHPWALIGSLRRGAAYATDALQVLGVPARAGATPAGLAHGLPSARLQHEHALAAIEDEALTLEPNASADLGFFGCVQAHHPEATAVTDLAAADAALALPEALASAWGNDGQEAVAPARTLFSNAPLLAADELDTPAVDSLLGASRRHEERDDDGKLLSFFRADNAHVVLRAKELIAKRPHGHILRSGSALVPDEASLTSTPWMAGVFHSMVTQGHVGINRFVSTVRGWLGQFRSHGLRVFVQIDGRWQLLGVPSAFEIRPAVCRWIYKHGDGLIEVVAHARGDAHELGLHVGVLEGPPLAMLASLHVALAGDDGEESGSAHWRIDDHGDGRGIFVEVPPGSGLAERFPDGGFRVEPVPGSRFDRIGSDELLFDDGGSRNLPFVCIGCNAATGFGLTIRGELVGASPPADAALQAPDWHAPDAEAAQLAEIVPWYLHDALVHYLSPRGLEQFTGGGWGTRDVCQGPLEMLLALDRPAPVRDLLLRVFAAQNADGDWPQWFMFFERERGIRAGDSHGDIVFWPLLGLARYLLATEDGALLDTTLPFHDDDAASLWQHVCRALLVIARRRIDNTHLAAYGHGDWNDSLQPVDAASRERLCSTWTVTLHHQVLTTLARALRRIGRDADAQTLEDESRHVLADFQHLLVADGVVAGYAQFEPDHERRLLLHPQDTVTGVSFSLLPMMHAVINDMLSPAQARDHLRLIEKHLLGPDGARLFDRPLPYRGGPQQLFQRAESSSFFGREIGVMYMHAHLRYAEMLAHVGEADRFFDALCKAHPILLRDRVPTADRRQANCYYSSSDAAFPDRYEAQSHYDDIARGRVALDGGWRVYSSGPGIMIGLVVGQFLGIRQEQATLIVDPVVPKRLDGLRATLQIAQHDVELLLRVGPRGYGPLRLDLNDQPLPFTRGANPYRTGAAEVHMGAVRSALHDGVNRLVIRLG